MSDVTRILSQIESGDPSAADELLPLVYDELRRLAAGHMANEAPGHTLDATALVHEAYLRLVARPEGIGILVDLSWLLATNPDVQRPDAAVGYAERANKATGNSNPGVLDVLAAAYAADGRMDMAAGTGRRAFQRALAAGDERLAADIRRRLQGYEEQTGAADSSGIQ